MTRGEDIPMVSIMDDVYYNKTEKVSMTKSLRDFHNLVVKRRLILGAANISDAPKTLIDYAVGKGGDLSKWVDAGLDFVFGVDVKGDNIENHLNGACARFINEKMQRKPPLKLKALLLCKIPNLPIICFPVISVKHLPNHR